MADIFNRKNLVTKQSFSADSVFFSFSGVAGAGGAGVGLLVQNMQISYMQPITRLYELGTSNVYYVAGRAQGQGGLGRIVGPGGLVMAFYQAYGDVCNAYRNVINAFVANNCLSPITAGSVEVAGTKVCMTGVVIMNVGLAVSAQDIVFSEQNGFMFNGLEICASAATPPADALSPCCASTLVSGPLPPP